MKVHLAAKNPGKVELSCSIEVLPDWLDYETCKVALEVVEKHDQLSASIAYKVLVESEGSDPVSQVKDELLVLMKEQGLFARGPIQQNLWADERIHRALLKFHTVILIVELLWSLPRWFCN